MEHDIQFKAKMETKEAEKNAENFGKKIERASDSAEKLRTSLKSTVTQVLSLAKRIDTLSGYTDRMIASQNVLRQTFGDSAKEVNEYAERLSYMTGIATTDISQKSSLFGQMATSLGMANEQAKDFVIALDDMSAKMALLYGADFNTMAKAMLDAVKGESSTLATLTGNVLKTGALQATLDSLGINLLANQLNGANKAMLEYITIARQVNVSNKDMAMVANDVAWQKQILKSQVKELSLALGNLLYPILKAILPVFNAILIVITEIINVFARLLGFNGKTTASVNSVRDSFDGLAGSVRATNSALKQLRGFDKLNNLITPSNTNSVLGGLGGLNKTLLDNVAKASENMLDIRNKAQEIAEKILGWLGYTQNANGEWEKTNITLTSVAVSAGIVLGAIKGINGILETLGGIGLISKGTTLGGILTGIGGTIINIVSSPLGIVALFTAFSVLAENAYKASDNLDYARNKLELWGGATGETKEHIDTVQNAVSELQQKVDYFTYSGLKMSEEDFNDILNSLLNLKNAFNTELDTWYNEQKSRLDELYNWEGAENDEEYQKQLEQLKNHYKEKVDEFNLYYSEYEKKLKQFYNNDGIISTEERLELLDIQEKMQKLSIESFAKNNEELSKMLQNYLKHKNAMTDKDSLEALQKARKNYDEQLKEIDAYYESQKKKADSFYVEGSDEYNSYMDSLTKATEKMRTDASTEYDKFYNGWAEVNDNLSNYVDKTTGTIAEGYIDLFGSLDGAILGLNAKMSGTLDETMAHMVDIIEENKGAILTPYQKKDFFNSAYNTGKQVGSEITRGISDGISNKRIKINIEPTNNGATLKVEQRMDGGFVNSGQVFIARENGLPEMVGKFGNTTAVANNDQIVKGIEQGVTIGMVKALNATNTNNKQPIYVKAQFGSEEVTDWVQVKQNERDRQYGF